MSEGVGVGEHVVLLVHEVDHVAREGRAAGVERVEYDAVGLADGGVRGHGEHADCHLDVDV